MARERAAAARTGVDRGLVLGELRDALADWQRLPRQKTGSARQALRALVTGRLVFTPDERDGEACYTFSGEGTISPVIAGVLRAAIGVESAAESPRSLLTAACRGFVPCGLGAPAGPRSSPMFPMPPRQ